VNEFLELNTKWKVYHMFIKEFVRIVLGKKVWKNTSYPSNLSEYCMASSEAFCLLVVENNYEWWTDMVRSGDQGNKHISAPAPLFTNAGTSKSELLWEPLFTPDLSTFLIGITKLKLS
jgi:hypothetical protein